MNEKRHYELHQMASLVIDAYLNRHKPFRPVFGEQDVAITYLIPPVQGQSKDEPKPVLNFWYERSDY